jgi:hypothetical protein
MRTRKEEKASQIIDQLLAKQAAHEASQRIRRVRERGFSQRCTSVVNDLKTGLLQRREQPLDDEVQTSLAELVCLLTDIAGTDNLWLRRKPQLIDAIDISIQALLSEPPNSKLAAHIQQDIYRQLRPATPAGMFASFKYSMKSSPSAVIVCGLGLLFCVLGALLVLLAVIGFLTHDPMHVVESDLNIASDGLLLISMAGALGSIVSIMMRIQDFSYTRSGDPWPFFFFGFFKPIVGAAFAVFVFAVVGGTILPLQLPREPQALGLLFLALAFIAGFSERFATDVVASVEHIVLDEDEANLSDSGEDKPRPNRNGRGEYEPVEGKPQRGSRDTKQTSGV